MHWAVGMAKQTCAIRQICGAGLNRTGLPNRLAPELSDMSTTYDGAMVAQNGRDRSACCPHFQVSADRRFWRERASKHRQENGVSWVARCRAHVSVRAPCQFTMAATVIADRVVPGLGITLQHLGMIGVQSRPGIAVGRSPIASPRRTGRSDAHAVLKTMLSGGNSITIVEPSRNRPISSPWRSTMSRSS